MSMIPDSMESSTEDLHPREDAVQVICRALAYMDCVVPVDPYDPEDVYSVASEAVWALMRAGLLDGAPETPTTSVLAERADRRTT